MKWSSYRNFDDRSIVSQFFYLSNWSLKLSDTSFRSMDLLTSHCTTVQLGGLSLLSKHNFLFSPTSYKSDGRLQCCVLRIMKSFFWNAAIELVSVNNLKPSVCSEISEVIIGWMTPSVAKVVYRLCDSDYTSWFPCVRRSRSFWQTFSLPFQGVWFYLALSEWLNRRQVK